MKANADANDQPVILTNARRYRSVSSEVEEPGGAPLREPYHPVTVNQGGDTF